VPVVYDRSNPSADFAGAVREECLDLVPLVKWMMGVARKLLLARSQRGNPIWVFAVVNPGKTEELLPLSAGRDRLDVDVRHWKSNRKFPVLRKVGILSDISQPGQGGFRQKD
jgi:hypothetical protein